MREQSNGKFKPLQEDYIVLSPSLDFSGNVGVVTVSIPVLEGENIQQKFFMITSDRKAYSLNPDTSSVEVEGKKIILKERQLISDRIPRWAWTDIEKFLNNQRIDPLAVFVDTRQLLLRYLEWQNKDAPTILALWIIGTYLYPIFDAFPYINLAGPKGSGKTKALDVIVRQAFNGRITANISNAALFRTIEATGSTLGIDEAESLKNPGDPKSRELKLLLNSGYRKGSSVMRCEGDDFTPREFDVYSPKVIAGIEGLDDVLESRCIVINMLRARPDNPVGRMVVSDRSEDWEAIRHKLYVLALTSFEEISNAYHDSSIVGTLNNRAAELWRPLLSIAKVIDPENRIGLYDLVYDQGLIYTQDAEIAELDDERAALIRVLIEITSNGTTEFQPSLVSDKLSGNMEDRTQSPFSPQWVGYRFKELGLRRVRKTSGTIYHCTSEQAIDLALRFGVEY